jgi:elongation factor G
MTDPFVGQLTFFRVYSGVINSGDTVYNSVKGRKSVSAVFCRCTPTSAKRSKKCAPATSLLRGLKDVTTGETLCDPAIDHPGSMVFPEP